MNELLGLIDAAHEPGDYDVVDICPYIVYTRRGDGVKVRAGNRDCAQRLTAELVAAGFDKTVPEGTVIVGGYKLRVLRTEGICDPFFMVRFARDAAHAELRS